MLRMNSYLKRISIFVLFSLSINISFAGEVKAPPRTIEDILQALENSAANNDSVQEAIELTRMQPPKSDDSEDKHLFFSSRSEAFARLGQTSQAIADLETAINEFPSKYIYLRMTDLSKLAKYETEIGNINKALGLLLKARELIPQGGMVLSYYIGNDSMLSNLYAESGDFQQAEKYIRDAEATNTALKRSPNFAAAGQWWIATTLNAKAIYAGHQGKWNECEANLRKAIPIMKTWVDEIKKNPASKLNTKLSENPLDGRYVIGNYLVPLIGAQTLFARSLVSQGKLVEAEVQIREAISTALSSYGKSSIQTAKTLLELSNILYEEDRIKEATQLAKESLLILNRAGASQNSLSVLKAKKSLARYLVAEKKYAEADQLFTDIEEQAQLNKVFDKQITTADIDWVISKIKIGQAQAAYQISQDLINGLMKQSNPSEKRLATLGALDAYALHSLGKNEQAHDMYKRYVPTLINASGVDAENQTSGGRDQERLTLALEGDLSTVASLVESSKGKASELVSEAFQLADVVRGSGVQRALTASAARASIKDPKLSELARKEQDIQRQIISLEQILSDLLSASSENQLPAVQAQMRKDIAQLKVERTQLKKEIELQFPDYANLVNPKPVTLESIKKLLKPEEVFVSWYFSDKESFVWAVTAHDAPQFHKLNTTRQQVAQTVTQLRRALDPNVSSVAELPRFDVALANRLYQDILAPIESALVGKKVMLTVPHGELGQLPLSLLVTQNTALDIKSKNTDFSDYRQVPWLMKNIAIAQLPSATALVSLRNAPKHNHVRRAFAGFGDPYFSDKQAEQAQTQVSMATTGTSRGAGFSQRSTPKTRGVNSAQLALLPRLPDTQDEIEQIAHALGADPAKDIFLHKQANVSKVLSTDLSDRQVVMFATHGLVPGDLDGLTQPALALTAPSVSGETEGDGLLTMDKILSMKLNADWVILSACNTALGEGAGAEAVSGLGRAFFYAGARALLVTNWPVDSQSATLLTSEMFHFFKEKPNLSKPEYLQMTMRNMLDNLGLQDSTGKTLYTYAHPLFWAPYVLVGD